MFIDKILKWQAPLNHRAMYSFLKGKKKQIKLYVGANRIRNKHKEIKLQQIKFVF